MAETTELHGPCPCQPCRDRREQRKRAGERWSFMQNLRLLSRMFSSKRSGEALNSTYSTGSRDLKRYW